jgi:hypothetical protein
MMFIFKPFQSAVSKLLRIDKLLGGSKYASLLNRARALMSLEAHIRELLPAPLKEHCRLLAVRDETLVLAADSPVWASRLRFHAPLLVKQLSQLRAVNLRTIRVRVRPPEASTATPDYRRPAKRCGAAGTAAIQQAAESVSDPELKTALLRLAGRSTAR